MSKIKDIKGYVNMCYSFEYIGKANACSASTSVGCSLRENIR